MDGGESRIASAVAELAGGGVSPSQDRAVRLERQAIRDAALHHDNVGEWHESRVCNQHAESYRRANDSQPKNCGTHRCPSHVLVQLTADPEIRASTSIPRIPAERLTFVNY